MKHYITATIGDSEEPEIITQLCTSNEQVEEILQLAMTKHLPPGSDIIFARLNMYGDNNSWAGYANISHEDYKSIIENIYTFKAIDQGAAINHPIPKINVNGLLSLEQKIIAEKIEEYGKNKNAAVKYLENLASKASKDVYARTLNIVSQKYGNCNYDTFNWSTIRYYHLEKIVSELREKNLSGSRINSFLTCLKGTAKQARKLKQLSFEDFESIMDVKSLKAERKPKVRFIDKDERNKIYSYLESEGTLSSIRNLAILGLTLGCGLRRDELCNLKLLTKDGITINKKTFVIKGKGNKYATINMPDWVMEWVNEWLEVRVLSGTKEGEFVFVKIEKNDDLTLTKTKFIQNNDSEPEEIEINYQLTGHGIAKIVKTTCLRAGVEPFMPHDLRATFCTNLLDSGVPLNQAKDMMRHSSVNTTTQYDRTNELKLLKMWDNANTK